MQLLSFDVHTVEISLISTVECFFGLEQKGVFGGFLQIYYVQHQYLNTHKKTSILSNIQQNRLITLKQLSAGDTCNH